VEIHRLILADSYLVTKLQGAAMTDIVLTAEAARIAGVVPATIRWWEKTGRLPAERTSDGTRLYRRGDVERVARQRQERRDHGQETVAVA
jgi:hypothetical protein